MKCNKTVTSNDGNIESAHLVINDIQVNGLNVVAILDVSYNGNPDECPKIHEIEFRELNNKHIDPKSDEMIDEMIVENLNQFIYE